jgi:penicillin-binding protein 1A
MSTSPSLIETIKNKVNRFLSIRKAWIPKAIKYIWILFLTVLLGVPLYVFTVSIDLFGLYGGMPSLIEIENPENDLSSELISSDGVSLGRYFRYNRSQVHYDELSTDLVNTLLISEDHRFYNHSGLDFQAFLRVIYGAVTFNPQGGGSTITQQLAKNLFTMNVDRDFDGPLAKLGSLPRRAIQKTKEWIISVYLEQNFTKEEIIALYLNTCDFSSNAFGIKVAAETYFNKTQDSLNLQESAVLVGMLQAPSAFNPKLNPESSLRKRNEVLAKLYRHGYKLASREQFDSIKSLPIELDYNVQNQNQGLAPYFRTVMGNYLRNFCNNRGIDLYNSGLKIYTTIDSRMQVYAEQAMNEHMQVFQKKFFDSWKGRNPWLDDNHREIKDFLQKRIRQTEAYRVYAERFGENSDSLKIMLNLKKPMTVFTWNGERDTLFSSMDSLAYYKKFLQAGFMAMDPLTGQIKAWVGGTNHKFFKFDHVKQAKRQPGSTFKPFVYGLAIEEGYSPCEKFRDISPQFDLPNAPPWYPVNHNGTRGGGGTFTMRSAMANSLNTITAQVMQRLGPENVAEFAHRMGIESDIDPVPSLCLGTSEMSLYEMVGAYSTFANNGIYTEPIFVTRIEDKNGNIIENFIPKTKQAINEQTAYKMIYMLRGGTEEEGGSALGLPREVRIDNEIGGKTGTTNGASDGWFIGVTHNLVGGAWVGGDERSIRFENWSFGQGSRSALPIFGKFLAKVYADPKIGVTKGQFRRPSSGVDISFDCGRVENLPDSVDLQNEDSWEIDH